MTIDSRMAMTACVQSRSRRVVKCRSTRVEVLLLCCMDTRLHRSRPPNVVLMQREAVETLALMPQMQMQVLCSSAKYTAMLCAELDLVKAQVAQAASDRTILHLF